MQYIINSKNFFRNKILEIRKNVDENKYFDANNIIIKNVSEFLHSQTNKKKKVTFALNSDFLDNRLAVGLYWPMKVEPDLLKLLAIGPWLIAIPKIKGEKMDFVKYETGSELETSIFGKIKQPKNNIKIIPDIIIVPGLAFSLTGHRLGFGTGHYDRFFSKIEKNIVKIGVCFHEYLYENIPYENHDIKMDYIITDKTIISL